MFSWSPSTMSMSLARSMGAAVRQRLAVSDQNAIDLTHISLFGHGLVDSRLNDYLLEHLPEYERSIRECDALLVAAHSQGVVLAGLLMEALLDQGWIAPGRQSHLGLLCMAGVHHGPFPDLPTDQFPATTELFSLGHPYAAVASRSLHAITRLLTAQVRIIAICAYMDSVVPLFSSAIHSVTSHPNLLRAIYTTDESDGFPVRLVAFCLEWRNLRSEQSDLLPHLSGFYRGSFFDRRGSHTTIHEERGVYDLAAEWVLSAPVAASNTDQAESALAQHTSAHWAIYLNDAFYYSDLNTYFIRSRLRWMMDQAAADERFDVEGLRRSYRDWIPSGKAMSHLHRILHDQLAFVAPSRSSSIAPSIDVTVRPSGDPTVPLARL